MHDRSHRNRQTGSTHEDAPARGPGKHSLTEHMIAQRRPPIFAGDAHWEELGPEQHPANPRPHELGEHRRHGAPHHGHQRHGHDDDAHAMPHGDRHFDDEHDDGDDDRHLDVIDLDDEHEGEEHEADDDHEAPVAHAAVGEHDDDADAEHERAAAAHDHAEAEEAEDEAEEHAHKHARHHKLTPAQRARNVQINEGEAWDLLGTYDSIGDRIIDGKLELDDNLNLDHTGDEDHDGDHDHKHEGDKHEGDKHHGEHAELELVLKPGSEGKPLDEQTLHELEQVTGFQLDHVRIHVGGEAGNALDKHGKRGATRGRHIWFPTGGYSPGDAAGKELIQHEVHHVIQQGSGHVPHKLDAGARATHEADADRPRAHAGKPRKREELRKLAVLETGPAQFRAADLPVHQAKPAPKPAYHPPATRDDHWNDSRRAAPKPAPKPAYHPPATRDDHWNDNRRAAPVYRPPATRDDHWNDNRRAAPRTPAPAYHPPATRDDHWNDANLRGTGVAEKVRQDQQMRQNLTKLAHMDGYKPKLPPPLKLTKREKRDLREYERSEVLVREGVSFAHGIRLKREAEERRRRAAAAAAKKKKGGGILGFAHKALDVAGYVPLVGTAAGVVNAGVYAAQGEYKQAAVELAGAAAGAAPLPPGVGHLIGKAVAKEVAGTVATKFVKKAAKKAALNGADVVKASDLPKTMLRPERRALARELTKTGKKLRKQQGARTVKKWEKRGEKVPGDIFMNNTFGNAAKELAGDKLGVKDDDDKQHELQPPGHKKPGHQK